MFHMVVFFKILTFALICALVTGISTCATTKQAQKEKYTVRSKHPRKGKHYERRTRTVQQGPKKVALKDTYVVRPDGSWHWVPPDRFIEVYPSPTPAPTPKPKPEPTPHRAEAF